MFKIKNKDIRESRADKQRKNEELAKEILNLDIGNRHFRRSQAAILRHKVLSDDKFKLAVEKQRKRQIVLDREARKMFKFK